MTTAIADQSPVSLRQSFDTAIQIFDGEVVADDYKVRASGTVTSATDPPRYAIHLDENRWTFRAQAVLQAINPGSLLDKEKLDASERSMYQHSEADIVRAAALYLLHPVNQALSSTSRATETFKCQSEASSGNIRADITYYKTRTGADDEVVPSKMRAFHVVEFKRRGVIRPSQFQQAVMPSAVEGSRQQKARWLELRLAEAEKEDHQSAFLGNSHILMKQAASYAITHATRYVALFDWDTLILLRFPNLDINLDDDSRVDEGVHDKCEMTIVINPRTMGRALLGFTYEAWEQTPS